MSTKFLMITSINSFETAYIFDSRDDAVDFINATFDAVSKDVISITETITDTYLIHLKNNISMDIHIKPIDSGSFYFHLIQFDNEAYISTRKFSTRDFAIDFVKNKFAEIGYDTDEFEDEMGEWSVKEGNINVKYHLYIVINYLKDVLSYEHEILGVKSNATKKEIRDAYRKKSKLFHPDSGGDESKFKEIHNAYQSLSNRTSNDISENVEQYTNSNISFAITYMLDQFNLAYFSNIRNEGKSKLRMGLVFLGLGVAITLLGYQSAEDGGTYLVLWGAIVVGSWNILSGLARMIIPDMFKA